MLLAGAYTFFLYLKDCKLYTNNGILDTLDMYGPDTQ